MNSCPPKPSPMPFIVVILLLISMIIGMIVYHFMFYKPSQETCANLYTSNICTKAVCEKLFPATPVNTTWEPVVVKDTSASPKFFGYNVTIPETGTVGTAYKAGLDSLMSDFDSNVCEQLTTMTFSDNEAKYHPGNGATPPVYDKTKIRCAPMIEDIDNELTNTSLTWLEKSKLLEVRRALSNLCTGFEVDGTTPKTEFPAEALSTKTGAISKIFCD